MALALIFDSVGFGEWFVLLAVILIVVGPRRLPEASRKVGKIYAKFRRAADAFKRQIMEMDTEFTSAVRDAERQIEQAVESEAKELEAPISSESGSEGAVSDNGH